MFSIKTRTMLLFSTSFVIFTACGEPERLSVAEGGFYESGLYFGKNFSKGYKRGIKDGCATAKGDYKKSHHLFKTDNDYNDGWFLARNRCKHLLIVEDENKTKEP